MKVEKVKFMLMAQDMDRAVAFHCGTFGFARNHVSDHWSELLFGDAIIALHGGGDGKINPTGMSIQVDDAEAAVSAIRNSGGHILSMPVQQEGEPIKRGTFRDTEGNEIMLTQWIA